jgi:hypothetical protein
MTIAPIWTSAGRWLSWASLVWAGITPIPAQTTNTNRFGFAGKEIFPIDYQISQLHAADLDGDGLNDLIVVNNARSKITFLYNQTGKTNAVERATDARKREVNELPPDARFRIESIASEKHISSLVVADLNSDGKPDLAYFGAPKELVVLYNQGNHDWSSPKRWPLEDGLLNQNALASGDLNGNGRPGLLLLAENYIYWLAQDSNHVLSEPEKIPYTGSLQAIQVLDIQGDGRDDLLLVNWESANPFRFRLQSAQHELGPEVHFPMPPIRYYWADDLDGDHKTEIITIAQKSGRAQISQFAQKEAEPLLGNWRQGQFELLPLNRTSRTKRGIAFCDIDGDGRADLLVAEPESGQLSLCLQQADGSLAAARTFPTLIGVSDIAVANWDGGARPEIFLLSPEERQIGVTQFDDKSGLAFPKVLPVEGRPLAMTTGVLATNGSPVLVVIADQDGRRELQVHRANGLIRRQRLSETFKGSPASLAILDVNQDGLPDIVILIPYEKLKMLLQTPAGDFDEVDLVPPGGASDQPWMGAADIDGDGKPELLLAQRNFIRGVVLRSDDSRSSTNRSGWTFAVKEQINGTASNSRIVAAASLRNSTNRLDSLFLLDAERKCLTLCNRNPAGAWQVVRSLPLPITEFSSMQPVALGGDNPNSIALLGLNGVGWMKLEGRVWEFTELDRYESPIKDAFLNDVVSGDLNQDGRKDLVFLETGKSYLDVVTFEPPHNLVPANRWQVFEERSFRSRRSEAPEPREALIADMTGDGKNDLVVLVHDRIILYPQE